MQTELFAIIDGFDGYFVSNDGMFFESVKAAADSVGGRHQNVSAVCKGRARSCMGHTFRYATDEEVRRCRALAERERGE